LTLLEMLMRPPSFLDGMLHDAAYACRSLIRNPGLLAAILLTLALGIGFNVAVYSAVHAILIQPPPYREPDRLVLLFANMGAAGVTRAALAGPEVKDFEAATKTLEGIAALEPTSVALTSGGQPDQFKVGRVTWNFFDVLGVRPTLGRTFIEGDQAGAQIVITWPLFQQRFGGDRSVLGRQVVVDDASVTVVGVLPANFRLQLRGGGLDGEWDLFTPTGPNLAREHRLIRPYRTIARLGPGVTFEQAAQDVQTIRADLARRFPFYTTGNHRFELVPLVADAVRTIRPALFALLAAVIVVLLAACVNVAGLLLARAAGRRNEIATLVALGADRMRMTRQYLVEGLLIAGGGALAGLAAGVVVLRVLVAFRPPGLERLARTNIETPVLLTIAAIAAAWGLLFALAPLSVLRQVSSTAGRHGARVSGRVQWRTRSLLVITQIALGTVLIVTAGLLVRTMDALNRVDTGLNVEMHALTFRVSFPSSRYPTRVEINRFSRALESRLRALPDVQAVGTVSIMPFDTVPQRSGKYLIDRRSEDASAARTADLRSVNPELLPMLGIQLKEGRWFSEQDDENAPPVSIVDEHLANRAWPGESALGRWLRVPLQIDHVTMPVWTTVVGVARHVRHRTPDEVGPEQVYVPSRQTMPPSMAFVVRTAANPGRLSEQVRGLVAGLDPRLPAHDIKPFGAYVTQAMATRRFTALLVSSFAGLVLLLAGVGLTGLVSYSVTSRQRELGIRMAIGATPSAVRRMVLGEGLTLVVAGVLVGLAAAAAAAQAMRALLFGVGPADVASYGGAVLLLCLTGLAAGWWPARRAMRVNPVEALRHD
jgi:putative ABC transport system permease protein